ncbi:hypothetical protein WN944_010050 [Citrus x changshan-huyou]|uniref:Ionotropic glutamate receptor C-terminal domain-containing protein n=1 Tax=Citrus x changshan-huyou TaxID=2935761 RepID=A0AAP0QWV2_9ROSI
MVVWLFVALVITQSYTAGLTSLLTVRRLDPATVDIEMLRRIGAKVGCDGFVVKYLDEVLESQPHNIKKIFSEIDYPEALLRGDTAAAFLEVPYVEVFPRNSPYFPDISQAVLEISGKGKLLQPKNSIKSTYKCSVLGDDEKTDSLGLNSFGGNQNVILSGPNEFEAHHIMSARTDGIRSTESHNTRANFPS